MDRWLALSAQENMSFDICQFAPELLLHIISFLPIRDQANLAQTCRFFRYFLRDERLFRLNTARLNARLWYRRKIDDWLFSRVTSLQLYHFSPVSDILRDLIQHPENTIEDLSFLRVETPVAGLHELASDALQRLRKVSFTHCSNLTVHDLYGLGRRRLEVLEFIDCPRLAEAILDEIAEMNSLRELTIGDCGMWCDGTLAKLSNLHQLVSLTLNNCNLLSRKGMLQIASLQHLENLSIGNCGMLRDDDVAQSLNNHPCLMNINLSRCSAVGGASSLEALSTCRSLKTINLAHCFRVNDHGLAHLATLPHLVNLNLSHCSNITDQGLLHLAKCTSLQRLDISSCVELTDRGIAMLCSSPHVGLEILKISRCQRLSVASAEALASHPLMKQTLTVLDVSFCTNLDDDAFEALSSLTQLRVLDAAHCSRLRWNGIQAIGRLPLLQELSIAGCPYVDMNVFASLLAAAPELRKVNVADCKYLSACSALRVALSRQNLIIYTVSLQAAHVH